VGERLGNWQNSENRPGKRLISFTHGEEGVILQPAENWENLALFAEKATQPTQQDSAPVGKLPEYVRRVRVKGRTYYYFQKGRVGRYCNAEVRLPAPDSPAFAEEYASALAEREEREAAHGVDKSQAVVYFVGADEGPIKIGWCKNIAKRLVELQCGNPARLSVLATAPGRSHLEAEYHRRFAAHRLHGEWFERHPDILAEIARLSSPTPSRRPVAEEGQ
jgi:hypothetical protein